MLIVIALGTLAINQTLGYYYKAKFLATPCALCEELNDVTCKPEIKIENKNIINFSLVSDI